jgi:mercuric ion binding protein
MITLVQRAIVVAVSGLILIACSQRQEEAAQRPTATVNTAAIEVPTVQCSMCTEMIEDALGKVEGVEDVKVELKTKVATVKFLPAKVDLARLEQAIASVGYDANSTKRDKEAYEQLPECCKEEH